MKNAEEIEAMQLKTHVEAVCTKISKNLGLLHRIPFNSPRMIHERFYYALISLYMIYRNLISRSAARTHLKKL